MKLSHIAAAILVFGAVNAASAADFTGFGLALDVQHKSTGGNANQSNIDTALPSTVAWEYDIGGKQEVVGGINMNFGFAVSQQVIMQVGVTADLGKTSIYSESYAVSEPNYAEMGAFGIKEKNHYSLYVAPGYLVSPKTMIYAKIAYHSMKSEVSDNYSGTDNGAAFSKSAKSSKSFKGYGLGAGVQTMMSDNLYAYAEVQRVQYGKETILNSVDGTRSEKLDMKPRTTIGTIGIGYRF